MGCSMGVGCSIAGSIGVDCSLAWSLIGLAVAFSVSMGGDSTPPRVDFAEGP